MGGGRPRDEGGGGKKNAKERVNHVNRRGGERGVPDVCKGLGGERKMTVEKRLENRDNSRFWEQYRGKNMRGVLGGGKGK